MLQIDSNMERLRKDAANNDASSRDGQMRNFEREKTDDADAERCARTTLLTKTNTDGRISNTTSKKTTSHMEHCVNALANQAHTETQDRRDPNQIKSNQLYPLDGKRWLGAIGGG